jgi:opacity protein-like surface antigen
MPSHSKKLTRTRSHRANKKKHLKRLLVATCMAMIAPLGAFADDWTGPYAGVSLSYGAGDDEASEINGPRFYIADFSGIGGSAHFGWQYQFQNLVAGLEGEVGYLDLGSEVTRDVAGGLITSGADLGAYATVTGRLGLVVHNDWLLYGRAGLAFAQIEATTAQTCSGPDLCGGAQSTAVSYAQTQDESFALVLGAGVERRLGSLWSGRIEYQFMDFRDELALPPVDGPGWDHDVDVHAVKLGLSRRF